MNSFSPRIYEEHGSTFYDDGRVHGAVDVSVHDGRRHLLISEWTSHVRDKGHSRAALQWLRPQFDVIAANGVGMVEGGIGDIATYYWAHMHETGLVDVLIDDEHVELEVLPGGAVRRRSTAELDRPG